jgi:adenosine deaminase
MNKNDKFLLCQKIPKAELHLHIEGAIEAELAYKLAKRYSITLPENALKELEQNKGFQNLQDFLDSFVYVCSVLITEQDFSDIVYEYLKRIYQEGVIYTEISFDPHLHISRGIKLETLVNGLKDGQRRGFEEFNIESNLIICFPRFLAEESCVNLLRECQKFKGDFIAVGLVNTEINNPPSKFKNLYSLAKEMGYRLTVHVGEDCGPEFINEAIDVLRCERIDHGITAQYDKEVMAKIARLGIPMTLCPISNKLIGICPDLSKFPIKLFSDTRITTTVNSDDPAFFGGYIADNYITLVEELDLREEDVIQLAKNSFEASFLTREKKQYYLKKVDEFISNYQIFFNINESNKSKNDLGIN